MVALIREPPRQEGPARRISLRSSRDEVDVSAIARREAAAGTARRPGSRPRSRSPRSSTSSTASSPARSATVRRSDAAAQWFRARSSPSASHWSTSPPGRRRSRSSRRCGGGPGRARATRERSIRSRPGCCVLLSGAATRLAPCFVGLDKRYVTDVDLTTTTSTGDPEGERLETTRRPDELDAALERLRGEVELPIPAASAVRIGGERAYKLARRGVNVEMPLRRSQVHALDVIAYTAPPCGSSCMSARARTSAPSRRRSAGTARACAAPRSGRSGRRGRAGRRRRCSLSASPGMLARLPEEALGRVPERSCEQCSRGEGRRTPGELERRPRAVAIGTFDGVHRGHRAVLGAALGGPDADGRHLPPASAGGARLPGRPALHARAAARAARRGRRRGRLVVEFTPEIAALPAEEFAREYLLALGAERVVAGEGFRFGRKRGGDLDSLRALGLGARCRSSTASRRRTSGAGRRGRGGGRPPRCSAGRSRWTGSSSAATSAAGPRLPDGEPRVAARAARAGVRDLRGRRRRPAGGGLDRRQSALRRLRAADRGVPARLGGRPVRAPARARAVEAPARRAGVRQRGRARRADRARTSRRPARPNDRPSVAQVFRGSGVSASMDTPWTTVQVERVICLECGWTYTKRVRDSGRQPGCPACTGREYVPASALQGGLETPPLRLGRTPRRTGRTHSRRRNSGGGRASAAPTVPAFAAEEQVSSTPGSAWTRSPTG